MSWVCCMLQLWVTSSDHSINTVSPKFGALFSSLYSTHVLNLPNGCLYKRGITEFSTSHESDRFHMINALENQ